ncbi:MAG: hypothetical protein HKN49_14385 [Gammaproteobacteria bacterium]|nr:hypothetical protein [Gammaproteobacteria bacterium]
MQLNLRLLFPVAMLALSLPSIAGIDRGGITLGVITSLEPLTVAGMEFDASAVGIDPALALGQVVEVRSLPGTGPYPAVSVSGAAVVTGDITIIDDNMASVLGQLVDISQLDPAALAAKRVAVHGFYRANDVIAATGVAAAGGDATLAGEVDETNGLVIQVNGTTVLGGRYRSDAVAAGDYVTVRGTQVGAGILLSDTITSGNIVDRAIPGEDIVLSGYLTAVRNSGDFDIGHTRVIVSNVDLDDDDAEDDDDDDNDGLGQLLIVTGVVSADGTHIVAESVDEAD